MSEELVLQAVLEQIGPNYSYEDRIGEGDFSAVYRLTHQTPTGEKQYALKIMDYFRVHKLARKENSEGLVTEVKERFFREIKLYQKFDHPNIVRFRREGLIQMPNNVEIPYLIMDYIKGKNLKQVIAQETLLPITKIVSISQDILKALGAMHKESIIHRNLEPGNIMIEENSGKAVLIDLGLARGQISDSWLTNFGYTSGSAFGSPAYMTPEQFKGDTDVKPTTDIYSMGVILYEMVTGELPYKGKNPSDIMTGHLSGDIPNCVDIRPDTPNKMQTAIKKALEKDTSTRYQSAEEILKDLDEIS